MEIFFDENSKQDNGIKGLVTTFLEKIPTLEKALNLPVIIFQDGVNKSYYIKCSIRASIVSQLVDLNAKLSTDDKISFRANRELLLGHKTYQKMQADALEGREFNDIIVEYNFGYKPDKPLKIWGGQHRSKAIIESATATDRYHGFRVFFNLTTQQRTELALVSNTNISVSNDTFDRMLEETMFGNSLRDFFQTIGFLNKSEDFPDVGSKSDKITVKLARSFIVNFYLGKDKSEQLPRDEIDRNFYDPYLVETGVVIDLKYKGMMDNYKSEIIRDKELLKAGKEYYRLHKAQQDAIRGSKGKIANRRGFRNKALVESVLCGWAFVAGLLHKDKIRLENHYRIPRTNSKIPDPLNSQEMSKFKHDSDPPTYRGLGTRSSLKDRQRIAQLFLAKSLSSNVVIEKKLMERAVSQVVGLQTIRKGYST